VIRSIHSALYAPLSFAMQYIIYFLVWQCLATLLMISKRSVCGGFRVVDDDSQQNNVSQQHPQRTVQKYVEI